MKLAITALVIALAMSTSAIATAADPQAEALYQEGRRAALVKDWPTACAKFQGSFTREAAPGTLLNLADCEENLGKLLEALAHFESAATQFHAGDERAGYAKGRAAALTRRIPKITLRLPESELDRDPSTVVTCDGTALDPGAFGTPLPLDPGDHAVVMSAPRRAPTSVTVHLAEGDSQEIKLAWNAPRKGADENRPVDGSSSPPHDGAAEASPDSSLRTASYVALGLGATGLVVGGLGAVLTLSAKSTVDTNCPAQGCNAEGLSAQNTGKTWSTVGTVGFIVGGVGVATGVTLYVLSPSQKPARATNSSLRVSLTPAPSGGALYLGGSF